MPRVMVNTWASWSRRRWRGELASDALPDGAAAGDLASDVAERVALQAAPGSLTSRQRAVLVLRIYDDLPEAPVAQVPGCAAGTVRPHTARAGPGSMPGFRWP